MKKVNVLVFPGGTENALEIQRALKHLKEVKLFSVSSNVINHADYVYESNEKISDVRSNSWINELNQIIKKNSIEYIFPANSVVIDALSRNRNKINAKILLPDENIINLTRSKKSTLNLFESIIPIPKIFNNIDEVEYFPVFTKPDNGYGSQNARIINTKTELSEIDFNQNIVQEYLPGLEYTIDCFSSRKGEVLFVQGRSRERIRMGTSMHSELVCDELQKKFFSYAQKIQEKLDLRGAWFFQMKTDSNGDLKLLEIDIRIAGTMALNRVRGVNFPLLTLFDFMDYDVSIMIQNYKVEIDRCLLNRYKTDIEYNTIYVDLDDSLIIHNQLNLDLLKFLYQCVNKKKKIVLISKNLEKDINAYLKKWKIFELFDEIHWLKEEESKADYIKDKNAIFIDDSFSQRMEVALSLIHI